MCTIFKDFLCTAQQLQQDTLFDVFVAFDGGCDRIAQDLECLSVSGQRANVLNVLLSQTWLLFLSKEADDSCGHDLSSEGTPCYTHVDVWRRPIDTSDFDAVAWLDAIDEIILEDDRDAAGQLAGWSTFRHLLDRDDLRVLIEAVSIFVSECITIFVPDGEGLCAIS